MNGKTPDRGRNASSPTQMPWRGWLDIARRVWQRLDEDNVSILSAGVAFYAMLAVFPALGAIVSVYALIAEPADVQAHFERVSSFMPGDVSGIFNEQLSALANQEQEDLSLGLISGILLGVWSAHRGVDALVRAVTVAYKESETRNFFKLNALTYVMTLGAVLLVVSAIALMVGLPTVISFLPFSGLMTALSGLLGWLLFVAIAVFAISVLYRFGPPRTPAKWRWVSAGALMATIIWMIGSLAFSYYVSQFGQYNETYGTLSAIVVLLTWFFVTSFSLVLGATVNAELEHQTRTDSTSGKPKPMGERGALVADTLGALPSESQ